MRAILVATVLTLTVLSPACSKQDAAGTQPAASGEQAALAAAPVAPAPKEEPAYITSPFSAVRREPSDSDKVMDPKTGKPVLDAKGRETGNIITSLDRGEQVTALQAQGDWIQVRASDETTIGWTKAANVLLASGTSLATVLEDIKMFARPDFASLVAGKPLAMGTLLFVTNSKGAFSEVNYSGSSKAWVQSDKLSADPKEIEACRLITKARYYEESKKKAPEKAKEFWDLAKTSFADTKLVQALAAAAAPAGEPAATP